jgi:hypothetical protein
MKKLPIVFIPLFLLVFIISGSAQTAVPNSNNNNGTNKDSTGNGQISFQPIKQGVPVSIGNNDAGNSVVQKNKITMGIPASPVNVTTVSQQNTGIIPAIKATPVTSVGPPKQ